MATYYNFNIIDLDEFTTPPIDEDGQYSFDSYLSIERISVGKIENRVLNYAASEMIDLLFISGSIDDGMKRDYKMFFGNLFWMGDEEFNRGKHLYFKDAWCRRGDHERPDFYSIRNESLKEIVSLESKIDFRLIINFFEQVKDKKKSFEISFNTFFELIQGWLTLYKIAVLKNAGVVYDIG